MTDTRFETIQGDAFAELAKLPDNSVDCLISDPPYLTTNLPFDKQRIDWQLWWSEVNRVCKPSAVQVCFSAGLFTVDLIQANRKNYRYDLVWSKPQSVGFLSANMRPLRAHESILVFCAKYGRIQGKMQSVYNPQMTEGAPYHHRKRTTPLKHYSNGMNDTDYDNPGTRHPTSVLNFGRDRNGQHPTQKPCLLMEWLIKSYTNVGDLVLDPFMGSGSTGVAALLHNRRFLGIERDPEYYAVASHRLREAAEGRA